MADEKAVFITWREPVSEFVERRYVGGGEFEPVFKETFRQRFARWSNDTSPASVSAAEAYCRTDRPEAAVVIR